MGWEAGPASSTFTHQSSWVSRTCWLSRSGSSLVKQRAPAPTYFPRMPHSQTCLALSLDQELMVSKWPLVISVGNPDIRRGERQFSPPTMMPLFIYLLCVAGRTSSSSLLPQGDRRPGLEGSRGCRHHSRHAGQWKGGHRGVRPGVHLRPSRSHCPGDLT